MSLIHIENLSIYAGMIELLAPISLTVEKGERLTILGQTGSGKSLLAQAIMGNLPRSLHSQGQVSLFGRMVDNAERQAFWGTQISMLPQEPWNSLDPLMGAKQQLEQTYRMVAGESPAEARQQAAYTLALQGLQDSGHKRVDQLSGGMAQRVAIACAMAGGAQVLLADEPTKGLDVSRRDQVVQQLLSQSEQGALITITHDVAVARQIGGRMMVIKSGELVEQGQANDILTAPKHPFTQALIEADPKNWNEAEGDTRHGEALISAQDLTIGRGDTALSKHLNFTLHQGEVVGVVGDSGCGKSTLGDTLLGVHNAMGGQVKRHSKAPRHQWQKLYQDPTAAVSPAVSLRTLLNDMVALHKIDRSRIAPLMQQLGLAEDLLERNSEGVSGGELQRFCMLRALLLNPVFLFADEPTSRLDPITQREVSQLLVDVAKQNGCAVMLVSHDPDLIEKRCDRVIRLSA
ncbi:Glutathione import ATP-binding protein GsiA [Marinomonas aquimarina]|uniref:Glutathione import ATP-binding protein GsiA n=1 Tax=Marinomonas aquimarina TaxID=295068 RepID=A0A1A8TBK2_9GAMM|nr:ATP-binding cassette domain-containing protein [Marinomonas aquimarina]SBS29177.1 Glutathione import ATP-binding protein GsiA [Marinomonas aquimarina]